MTRVIGNILFSLMTTTLLASDTDIQWRRLPDLPDHEGFAGSFAGVSANALVVAGGANLTGDKWRDHSTKKWYDSAFVLARPEDEWRGGFKLPRAVGYGVAVTTDEGVTCIGGEVPFSRATVPVVQWGDRFVIPNGEVRPRVRTPEVWALLRLEP